MPLSEINLLLNLESLLYGTPKWYTPELGRLPGRHDAVVVNEGRSRVASDWRPLSFYSPTNGNF